MSELEASILKAIEKLTHDLAQLRSGGRLNPDLVESLKVQLGTAGQGKETVRLGDIAQVVPRGRVLNVICGDDAVGDTTTHDRNTLTAHSTSSPSPPPSPPRPTPSHRLRPSRATRSPSKFPSHHRPVTHDETPSRLPRRRRRRPTRTSSARDRTTTSWSGSTSSTRRCGLMTSKRRRSAWKRSSRRATKRSSALPTVRRGCWRASRQIAWRACATWSGMFCVQAHQWIINNRSG